jgi:lipopolysaccharide export system protein LptA
MEMDAQIMQWNRATGEMTASGGVQTTLLGEAQGTGLLRSADADADAATHILADRALLRQPQQEADFSGHVRLWQGADVLEAPALEFFQARQEIVAFGAAGAGAVHGTFVQAPPTGAHASTAAMPVNVTGDNLLYSGAERKAHWTGGVTATMQAGQLQADAMDLYLEPAPAAEEKKSPGATVFTGQSAVERFVVLGHVRLTQPGRQGTGEQIVYTASDGHFVLTGTQQQPPLLVDAAQGSLTGRALIFASEQNTVQVLGGQQPTTAVTRVQK